MESHLLSIAEEVLGWPSEEEIFHPKGVAKRILKRTVDRKIGNAIRRLQQSVRLRMGALFADPSNDLTEAPLAIVCEFSKPMPQNIIMEVQRLAWNFSISPQVIIVEPHLIRSFTCCEQTFGESDPSCYEVERITKDSLSSSTQAARALHWVNLVTGEFFRTNIARFRRSQRADRLLLSNLRYVRHQLLTGTVKLDLNICHDLLARVIFLQFLMDRKDKSGKPALDSVRLEELCGGSSLWEILRNKQNTYSLFRYLNRKFNGDLFAADNGFPTGDDYLRYEQNQVQQSHLDFLADFVEGNLELETGQPCLWRQYSFDVFPLEFISSIYEEFVPKLHKSEGIYYTPQHLVDLVLDGVLPWDGKEWNLRIMDPACGSGVFLVKAFQRLVHRWKRAHRKIKPTPDLLRKILSENISGIDINPQAIRVASFSLLLFMCEEIEPISLWEATSFPKLTGKRLICADFFDAKVDSIFEGEEDKKCDLVVGNPPWGKNSTTSAAELWAHSAGWPLSEKDIGTLFVPRCESFVKENGIISMLQPAKALLFNTTGPARKYREQIFSRFKVEEITNLAALRFEHFEGSDAPVAVITLRNSLPDGNPLVYLCPKPRLSSHDKDLIIIESHDVNLIFPEEAAKKPQIWGALMWGSRRDLEFIEYLINSPQLRRLWSTNFTWRAGIIRGQRTEEHKDILNRRILKHYKEAKNAFINLKATDLSYNDDIGTHRKTDLAAFELPQLILKRSWVAEEGRFRAFVVESDKTGKGILIPDTYISVHAPEGKETTLEAACLSFNSILAVYYLFLISGQFAIERPKVSVKDCLSVPIPEPIPDLLASITDFKQIDDYIRRSFAFSEIEWALIEDMVEYTIPYFKRNQNAPERPTERGRTGISELELYFQYLRRVLKAGFGSDKNISCLAFSEASNQKFLPVRLVCVYLNSHNDGDFDIQAIDNNALLSNLARIYKSLMQKPVSSGGFYYQRTVRTYDVTKMGSMNVPTVYIIKPDEVRYWTRSMALRDADEVAADIMAWGNFLKRDDNIESTHYAV